MVVVAQLVRALDCGSRGRRFETGLPPLKIESPSILEGLFYLRMMEKLLLNQKGPIYKLGLSDCVCFSDYSKILSTTTRCSLLATSHAV